MRDSGYDVIDHFTSAEPDRWTDCYDSLRERIEKLRVEHADDSEAQGALEATEKEIDVYGKHSASYGYVFYVMQENRPQSQRIPHSIYRKYEGRLIGGGPF